MLISYHQDKIESIGCNAGRLWRTMNGYWCVMMYAQEEGLDPRLGEAFTYEGKMAPLTVEFICAFAEELGVNADGYERARNYVCEALGLPYFDYEAVAFSDALAEHTKAMEEWAEEDDYYLCPLTGDQFSHIGN